MSAMAPAQRTIVSAELLYWSVYDEMMIFYVERLSRMAGPFFLPRVSTAAAPVWKRALGRRNGQFHFCDRVRLAVGVGDDHLHRVDLPVMREAVAWTQGFLSPELESVAVRNDSNFVDHHWAGDQAL